MNGINWQYFPKSNAIPNHLKDVIAVFEKNVEQISSYTFKYSSDEVLEKVRNDLEIIGFRVEISKKHADQLKIPVLFGLNGSLEKYFDADGYNDSTKTVIEVEAGRGVTNYQFLKDLFQACMMHDVDNLVIGIRNIYSERKDFHTVRLFFDTLYSSNRLKIPLKGVLIIGY